MRRRVVSFVSCVLTFALLSIVIVPQAQAKSPFTSRRIFGALFVGGSIYMAKKARDFNRSGDQIYQDYLVADNSQDAERLYDRASDRDTKSQMSIAISTVLLVSGLRLLLFSGVDDNIPKIDRKLTLDLQGDVQTQTLGVSLKRQF